MSRVPKQRRPKKKRPRRPPPEPLPPPEGLPRVAIVGRPNVGKSTLFNTWSGRRRSIVSATPGTTRDRLSAVVVADRPDGGEVTLELVDTGGLGVVDAEVIATEITRQIKTAIAEADVIILLLDVRTGLLPLDREVADVIRRSEKPVVVAANKCETEALDLEAANFASLGLGEPVPVSAESRRNLDELRERVAGLLPELEPPPEPAEDAPPRIAVVGRRNAGKSTFVNALAGSERVVVSELPGTTRDTVDVSVEVEGKALVVVDTAGLGRKHEGKSAADHFSLSASRRAIERSEAVLLLVDARTRVGTVEREIAKVIGESCRPAVIVVNKWDLVQGADGDTDEPADAKKGPSPGDYTAYIARKLGSLSFAPIVFASALAGDRVVEAAGLAAELAMTARRRHPTSALNRMLGSALKERSPSSPRGRLPRAYYATQTGATPPTVTVFVNDPARFNAPYVKFLTNRFREYWDGEGGEEGEGEVPVRVILRARPRG
jgi:GTP-binding protein